MCDGRRHGADELVSVEQQLSQLGACAEGWRDGAGELVVVEDEDLESSTQAYLGRDGPLQLRVVAQGQLGELWKLVPNMPKPAQTCLL